MSTTTSRPARLQAWVQERLLCAAALRPPLVAFWKGHGRKPRYPLQLAEKLHHHLIFQKPKKPSLG
jgi:hypothetical protein